ncbi:MAG TPA: hypothetical protein VN764_19170 [Polyangiaceae bacterium]|nr:hypothetical protein [Polyangiaceae bacterium]
MAKERDVSESELHQKGREAIADASAKFFKHVHDCYPGATRCGRCGAKKGSCGCGFFPYLGTDALYQLSRLHAQNVSHMVRLGLSTWDILTGAARGCSRCSCSPCRCQNAQAASAEAEKHPSTRAEPARRGSVELVTERLKYDPKSPNFRPYTMLQARNRSDAPAQVELRVSEFTYIPHGTNMKETVSLSPDVHYSSREVGPQQIASVYVYFTLQDLMAEKWEEPAVALTTLTGSLGLYFNGNPVALTEVHLEVNHLRKGG